MSSALERMAAFVARAEAPAEARSRAATAVCDTVGVALGGFHEPAAAIVRQMVEAETGKLKPAGYLGPCSLWGSDIRTSAPQAALANGTAAHALDFDDMCFVSLAHPSAPLVPAVIAVGEYASATGRAVLDAYAIGFEIQARLGRLMNPRHYQRGWHCTSTLGVMSAAAGSCRLLGLDVPQVAHAIGIAASSASGLKENFGTMVKPLHAGLAARDGVMAAMLAKAGFTASASAVDGPQGYLHVLDSQRDDLEREVSDLGTRWEILDTGITVKLYPSCAGTHPTLDALLDLRSTHGFAAADVDRIDVDVDPIVPTILIYDRPTSALEAKFSLQFCAAAAVVFGRVGIDTFDEPALGDDRVAAMMTRVTMRVDHALGVGKPALTEARVRVSLKNGTELTQDAHGARGYPANPAAAPELRAKFLACAARVLDAESAVRLFDRLAAIDGAVTVDGR